ncbi:MAG: hypothetical protein SGI84_13855 [Gemmatimonadota bacterium]|nr:hypothetical protein [Gemmatimonadota bacterium]
MTGCLTFPLRVLFSLLLIAGLAAGWIFRDELLRVGRQQLGMAEPPSPIGAPDPARLASGRARMDSLARAATDSIVLTPAEVASLVGDQLARSPAGAPESLTVELGDRELTIRARVATAPIPEAIRDLLGSALGERETVEVGGVLGLRRQGEGEFEVRRVRVKGFPVPRELVNRLIGRYLPQVDGAVAVFAVPAGITGIRITPGGAILHGRGRR